MKDEYESALSAKTRDYPAWSYLLMGIAFGGAAGWIILAGVNDEWRRPLTPWFGVAVGLALLGKGAQEGWRNRSLTARRSKSEDEQREDAEEQERTVRRLATTQAVRLAVVVLVLVAAGAFAIIG